MRSVGMVARQMAGSVSALVAASVLGASGCAESSTPTATDASAGSAGVAIDSAGTAASLPYGCSSHEVASPSGGQPARLADICAVDVEPVISGAAVRVSLALAAADAQAPVLARLTLAAELREKVRATPAVEMIAASNDILLAAQLSPLTQATDASDGYTFKVTWPSGVILQAGDRTHVTFRTALDLGCDSGVRLVQAVTEAHLCGGEYPSPITWASSGDMCVVCYLAQPSAGAMIPQQKGAR